MNAIDVLPEVREALAGGGAVVALESAVTTSGLPAKPLGRAPACGAAGWLASSPIHLETARSMEQAVRTGGAVPATIAVIDGVLRIGLSDADLQALANDAGAGKVAARDLAPALSAGRTAGTTVSATLAACHLASPTPIRVMATGGIGGVHRDWSTHPDISSDLFELARTQVAVVCSGVKSILDVSATLEALETLGVPVVGYGTDLFPRFLSCGDTRARVSMTVNDVQAAARLCRTAWTLLARPQGVLIAQPPPAGHAIAADDSDRVTDAAMVEAERRHILGPARTPFLLAEVARRTGGQSVEANVALLLANARLAASLACALANEGRFR